MAADLVVARETLVRLVAFLAVLAAMAVWEALAPRRRREIPRVLRWTNNFGVVLLDALIVRLTYPVLAVSLAAMAEARGWGVLQVLDVPPWLALVVSFVVLDLAMYLQHVMFHAVPALWRLHRVHHADVEFDVSTGLRFHPLEILLSVGLKLALVLALGPPALAVLAFEVLLNAASMFNHGNVRLSSALDAMLRWVLVTPDMHRVHHSAATAETNTNFGFLLPWWDRALGTYRAQPGRGHEAMTIGLTEFRSRRDLWLDRLLWQPWRGAGDESDEGRS